ncbi:MAG TPA: hypothetical protein VGL61_09550 [Kofleriaceae bacterium]|jgi:hypothetical protein
MPDIQSDLSKSIDQFVAEISALAQRAAISALERALGADARPRGATRIPRTLARGGKRSGAQLETLADAFYDFVSRHPGLRIEHINRELATTTKDLSLPIRHLIAEGALKTKGKRRATTYFAAERKKTKKS